jgi:hypothetical protein
MTEQPLSDFARQVAREIALRESCGIPVAKVNGNVATVLKDRGYIARFSKHGVAIGRDQPPRNDDIWKATPAGRETFGRRAW